MGASRYARTSSSARQGAPNGVGAVAVAQVQRLQRREAAAERRDSVASQVEGASQVQVLQAFGAPVPRGGGKAPAALHRKVHLRVGVASSGGGVARSECVCGRLERRLPHEVAAARFDQKALRQIGVDVRVGQTVSEFSLFFNQGRTALKCASVTELSLVSPARLSGQSGGPSCPKSLPIKHRKCLQTGQLLQGRPAGL